MELNLNDQLSDISFGQEENAASSAAHPGLLDLVIPVIDENMDLSDMEPKRGDMVISVPLFVPSSEVVAVDPQGIEDRFLSHKIRGLIDMNSIA